jgi:GTP 3',8-cyclase
LYNAGLSRVTVSLDALSEQVFRKLNDVDFSVQQVLEGIEAAHQAGLGPVKVNMVVKKSVNHDEIVPMARYFKPTPHILRFIEFMDVGSSNDWKLDEVLPSREVIERIQKEIGPLEAIDPNYEGEVAERWRYADGQGEIGIISSVTQAFCKSCSRVRLSTEGQIYTCLFATQGHNIKPLLRSGHVNTQSDELLENAIYNLWRVRADRYSEVRSQNTVQPKNRIEMSYIGG